MDDWGPFDREARGNYRARATTMRMTLRLGDDSKPLQTWQAEGYPTELRMPIQRHGEFGLSSMPLAGAGAHVSWHGGYRGFGRIQSVEDPRYRPTGLKGGETLGYMVDGADEKGEGGTLRKLWQGLLGWAHAIFGKTIAIGTQADTTTITIDASGTITIKADTIVLDGAVKLGSATANIPVSKQGTVDSRGDTDTSNFAPNVYVS